MWSCLLTIDDSDGFALFAGACQDLSYLRLLPVLSPHRPRRLSPVLLLLGTPTPNALPILTSTTAPNPSTSPSATASSTVTTSPGSVAGSNDGAVPVDRSFVASAGNGFTVNWAFNADNSAVTFTAVISVPVWYARRGSSESTACQRHWQA